MPSNTDSSPNTLTNESITPTARGSKAAKGRSKPKAERKTTGAASTRSAAPRTPTPAEIVFDELPNPNHLPVPPFIWIDHPQQNERLLGPLYNIRMGIGGAEQVDISIDGGTWQICRLTSGYWWYDWANIQPGKHTLVARMRMADGRWYRTPVRNCDYRP